jgi:signal transduction histidine kinase
MGPKSHLPQTSVHARSETGSDVLVEVTPLRVSPWRIPTSTPRRSFFRAPGLARTGRLTDALVAVGAGTVLAASIEIGVLLDQPFPDVWLAVLFPAIGLVYLAAGLMAWARRPSSRLGFLIVIGAWACMLAGLGNIDSPTTLVIGEITATLILAVVAQLLVSFPTGRLHSLTERVVVAAVYVVCLVLQVPLYVYAPGSPLTIDVDPGRYQTGVEVQRAAGAAAVIAISVLLIGKMRRATPEQRRVLVPLSVYGIVGLLFIPVTSYLFDNAIHVTIELRLILQQVVLGLLPVVFVLAASRGGFERTGDLTELGVWLSADELGRPELRDALATTLGDASVELLFHVPGEDGLVDDLGIPVHMPVNGNGRGLVDVELGGRAVGAIAYDAALADRPEEIREAGRVVALALDRERLTVELRASRARLVAAADGERRRIARDLHDGLQSRLVFLGIQAGTDADRKVLGAGIQSAIDELRELVDGVMPAQLTQRGLTAAIEELRDRTPVPITLQVRGLDERVQPGVEIAAYFVVSEAIVNAVKHADATVLVVSLTQTGNRLRVEVTDDGGGGAHPAGGIQGMADRVEALGGELTVDSRAGGGTSVRAVIPCGS